MQIHELLARGSHRSHRLIRSRLQRQIYIGTSPISHKEQHMDSKSSPQKRRGGSTRRQFLRNSAVVAAGTMAFPYILKAQGNNDKINVACIGVGGKGDGDSEQCRDLGAN